MKNVLTCWRKPMYNTPEKIEKYFLCEFVSGELDERARFVSTMFRDKEKFLTDTLLRFRELTDDYTDTEVLKRAFAHGICQALIRKLKEE